MNSFQAVFITFVYSVLVIIALYLQPIICPKVSIALYRPISISVMAVISYFLIYYFNVDHLFHWFYSPYLSKCSIFSTVILFLGPILQNIFTFINYDYTYIYKKSMNLYFKHLQRDIFSAQTFKALVIGPVTEEMIYRSFACSLWESANISYLKTIFLLPFLFGVSHLNKVLLEKKLSSIRLKDFAPYVGMLGFTTVFGWWEAFVWLRTHSYFTCVIIHTFCNYMQFPDFREALEWQNPLQRIFLYLGYLIGVIYFSFSIGLIQTTKII